MGKYAVGARTLYLCDYRDTVKSFVCLVIVLLCGSAFADSTFTIGAGTGPECDMTYLNSALTSTVYGNADSATAQDSCSGASKHILFRWGAIADSLNKGGGTQVFIRACSLFVKQRNTTDLALGLLKVSRLRRPFNETLSTWLLYDLLSSWTTAGARDTTDDIDTIPNCTDGYSITNDNCLFSTTAHCSIDITQVAKTMDGEDTALWRDGLMLYGPWTYGDASCANSGWRTVEAGYNFSIYSDDAATAADRPYIKVVYTQDPMFSSSPRPPLATIYALAATGTDSGVAAATSTAGITSKRTGHRLQLIGKDSVAMLWSQYTGTTFSTRVITTANGGTSWTTNLLSSFPANATGSWWIFKDSGWITNYQNSATLQKTMQKWKQVTPGIYDTLLAPNSRVGDRQASLDISAIGLTSGGDSMLVILRPETGTSDTTVYAKSNGAHTQTSTWATIDKGLKAWSAVALEVPLKDIGGILWWDDADDLFYVSSTNLVGDTLSTALTGMTLFSPTSNSWLTRTIIPIRDSFFIVAYEEFDGADTTLCARPFHVSSGGAKAGTLIDTVIADAAAQVLEVDADLPIPDNATPLTNLGYENPCLVRIRGSDTVYCFYWYWPNQAQLDQAQIVYKRSLDKGVTWDASRTVVIDTNTSGVPHTATGGVPNHKFAMFAANEGNSNAGAYGQHQMWLGWSDSATASARDTIRLAQVVVQLTAGTFTLGRGSNEALDNRLRQQVATTNYGTDTVSYFGGDRTTGVENTYIFSFPTLASNLDGRTVDSAKLTLRLYSQGTPTSDSWGFNIVRRKDWSETQSTWRIYKTATDWADSGANNTTSDIYPTVYNTFTETFFINNADVTVNVSDLLKAVDGNDTTSAGFTLSSQGGDFSPIQISSGNNVNVGRRPYLQVWWHLGVDAGVTPSARRRKILGYKERIDAYSIPSH
jgi:hypothetical protein